MHIRSRERYPGVESRSTDSTRAQGLFLLLLVLHLCISSFFLYLFLSEYLCTSATLLGCSSSANQGNGHSGGHHRTTGSLCHCVRDTHTHIHTHTHTHTHIHTHTQTDRAHKHTLSHRHTHRHRHRHRHTKHTHTQRAHTQSTNTHTDTSN